MAHLDTTTKANRAYILTSKKIDSGLFPLSVIVLMGSLFLCKFERINNCSPRRLTQYQVESSTVKPVKVSSEEEKFVCGAFGFANLSEKRSGTM